MTAVRILAIAITVLQSFVFAAQQDVTRGAREGSLDELRVKTGWIPLGLVTNDGKQWAVGADSATEYNTGAFEFVDKTTDRRKPVLPRAGDRIRLTARNRLIILGFASTGERRALEDPSLAHPAASDLTEIILPKGSVVEVQEIRQSSARGDIRTVWARIAPAKGSTR
jgi:hypothetical protein